MNPVIGLEVDLGLLAAVGAAAAAGEEVEGVPVAVDLILVEVVEIDLHRESLVGEAQGDTDPQFQNGTKSLMRKDLGLVPVPVPVLVLEQVLVRWV